MIAQQYQKKKKNEKKEKQFFFVSYCMSVFILFLLVNRVGVVKKQCLQYARKEISMCIYL